ncbi:Ankyrin repeat domain-containing protein 13C, partial [Rhizoclosmatium sp. JEL0117]
MEEAFSLIISNSATTLKTHISTAKPSTFTTQIRGHSLLSLAIALNHKECIKVLLDHPLVSSTLRTRDGWSPLQEAASVGDRDVVAMVLVHWRREMVGWWETRGSLLVEALHELSLPDFSITLHWRNVRIDSTLVGFESLSWVRGNVSILCVDDGKRVVLVDHDRRVVQQVVPRVKDGEDVLTEEELQEEVNILLNTPLVSPPHVDVSKAKVRKVQDGVLFKTDRVETVNGFDATVWVIEGISVET